MKQKTNNDFITYHDKEHKPNFMHNILKASFVVMIAVSLVACNSNAKDKKGGAADMKAKLEKLKKEKNKLEADIRTLEDQIAKADPESAKLAQKLVSVDSVRIKDFTHYIELQGKIDAEGMAYVAPTGPGGQVKAVYVKAGQKVSKGQLILKLDDAMARQSVVAAQQQTGQLRARLAQYQSIYERQQNLWKQNIGSEIQVINAKADVDAMAAQLRGAEASVALAQEQVNMSNVHAQISGMIDEMNIEPGEFFSPQTAAAPGMGIRIVNNNNLKIVTKVPENYVTRIKKGDKVEIVIADSDKPPYQSVISMVGGSIDPITRSFAAEAKLPSDPALKPNQTATMKILDYEAKAAIAIDVNVVQPDEKGKYVYVMVKEGDKMLVRKRIVTVGEAYNGLIEIKSGLKAGDLIITEGYQTVYEGQAVTTGKKNPLSP